MVYAATALHEHEFNIKENLKKLTKEQHVYIHDILMESLNHAKMQRVLSELEALQPQKGTLEQNWLEDFRRAYEKNFSNHLPVLAQVPSLSKEWANNLVRLLGVNEKTKTLSSLVEAEETGGNIMNS